MVRRKAPKGELELGNDSLICTNAFPPRYGNIAPVATPRGHARSMGLPARLAVKVLLIVP